MNFVPSIFSKIGLIAVQLASMANSRLCVKCGDFGTHIGLGDFGSMFDVAGWNGGNV